MKDFIKRSVVSIVLLLLVFSGVFYIFASVYTLFPSDQSRHHLMIETLTDKNMAPEIVVFGSSLAMFAIDAKILTDKLPGNPFAISMSSVGQNPMEAFYFFPLLPKSVKTVIHCVEPYRFIKPVELENSKALNLVMSGYDLPDDINKIIDKVNPHFYEPKWETIIYSKSFLRNSLYVYLRCSLDSEEQRRDMSKINDIFFPNPYMNKKALDYSKTMSRQNGYDSEMITELKPHVPDERLKKLFVNVNDYLAEKGIKYIIVLHPVNPDRKVVSDKYYHDVIDMLKNEFSNFLILDFSKLWDHSEYFYDSVHLNKEGAEIFSQKITDSLN